MAAKKPAKAVAGQVRAVVQDPEIYGSLTRLVGTKQSPSSCEECGRQLIRGIVRLKKEKFFCSSTCAKNDWSKNQQSLTEA